jgi:hypothetical protein
MGLTTVHVFEMLLVGSDDPDDPETMGLKETGFS